MQRLRPPPIKLGQLSTALSKPPKASSRGAFPIYGSDMYTRVCYRRGPLWFVAAYYYELDIPYLDFKTWEKDLLSFLGEVGL
ncbi:MAG TPA: hypothetical protein PKI03_05360 [Pseudomonadota bacterium]|nr:hypothetical protein [Pseudomonadota bacterium]